MKTRTTLILLANVVFLFIVIFILKIKSKTNTYKAKQDRVLIKFDVKNISKISIERSIDKVVIKRNKENWFFPQFDNEKASNTKVKSFLNDLNHLKIVDKIKNNKSKLDFGLRGDKAIKIKLFTSSKNNKETVQQFVIGTESPVSNAVYALSFDNVYIINSNPRKKLTNAFNYLFDQNITKINSKIIDEIKIKFPKNELLIKKNFQKWNIVKPIKADVDNNLMDNLISGLISLNANNIIKDSNYKFNIPSKLNENEFLINIIQSDLKYPIIFYFKKVKSKESKKDDFLFEVNTSNRPSRYLVRNNFFNKFPKEIKKFRNKSPINIPDRYIDSIVIRDDNNSYTYIKSKNESKLKSGSNFKINSLKSEDKWEVLIGDRFKPVDYSKIKELVDNFNKLSVLDFSSNKEEDREKFGFTTPKKLISFSFIVNLKDKTGKLKTFKTQKDILISVKRNRVFLKLSDEPFIYEVAHSFIDSIEVDPILWRSLSIIKTNFIHVKSIIREVIGRNTVKLNYDYKRNSWEAFQEGIDVTENLDEITASSLRDRLASLTALKWSKNISKDMINNYKLVSKFVMDVSEFDFSIGEPSIKTYVIKFFKSPINNIYLGTTNDYDIENVFYIKESNYNKLIRPVISFTNKK